LKALFSVNTHIYNTPTDVVHFFSSGLAKSDLIWTLRIINEINTHQATDKSSPFSNNNELINQILKEFITVPEFPHLK